MKTIRIPRLAALATLCLGLLFAGLTTGCSSAVAGGPALTPCEKARAAYNQVAAAATAADAVVESEQVAIDALPPADPIRKALERPLATAMVYAKQVQVALSLAKVAVAAMCPELPQTPTVPAPVQPVPSTQPVH
jgi:hypothetical protein